LINVCQERFYSDSSSSSDEVQNALKAGLLKTVVQELKGLLHDLLRKEAKGSCLSCGADVNEKMKLEIQLHKSTESYEKLDRCRRRYETFYSSSSPTDGRNKLERLSPESFLIGLV
jgi:hypothetical protein